MEKLDSVVCLHSDYGNFILIIARLRNQIGQVKVNKLKPIDSRKDQ